MSSNLQDLRDLHTYLWGENRIEVSSAAGESYSTLDLSLFRLNLNVRPDYVLLVREEYILAYEAILADTLRQPHPGRWRRSATLVTGQPGTGKTLFLCYILARRLYEKEPVVLQINADQFALFDQSGVTLHSSVTGRVPEGAWALADASSDRDGRLCDAFQAPFAHVIYTSFQTSHRWVKRLSATVYIMDVWSPGELRTLLTIRKLDVNRGMELFLTYGPSPRIIIDIITRPAQEAEYVRSVRAETAQLAPQITTVLLDIESLSFSSDIFSKIFILRPVIPDRHWPALYIPTQFLATCLGLAVSRQVSADQRAFFAVLSRYPSLHNPGRWLFENYAHVSFADPNRNPLQAYLPGQLNPDLIPAPTRMISGSLRDIQPPHNFYWRPQEPNYGGVDAIIRVNNTIWALQLTIYASHRSMTNGLSKVLEQMNHSKGLKWRVVVVGLTRAEVESVLNHNILIGQWKNTPVYTCELPLDKFMHDQLNQLRHNLERAGEMYPRGQGMKEGVGSDVPVIWS